MARASVFVDSGLDLAETLPAHVVGVRFDVEARTIDEAIGELPEELRHLAAEAEREARIGNGEGLVDRPSTGWWASAVL